MSGGYYQFQAPQLRVMPIRRISFTTATGERERLGVEGRTLYDQGLAESSHASLLSFVDAQLPKLSDGTFDMVNEHSDVVHDLLAYLAEQTVRLCEQRQSAVDDFVLDLEGVLSSVDLRKIGRLWTPPSAPKPNDSNFAGRWADHNRNVTEAEHYLGPLAARRLDLRKDIGSVGEEQWKWMLKRRLTTVSGLANLVKIHRVRQPAIRDLDERIVATDALIDSIVYALYGLDEDEIAMVEGTAPEAPR